MSGHNPRFPHSFRILRPSTENGLPVIDADGNPVYDNVAVGLVECVDGVPIKDEYGDFVTSESDTVPFGYRTSTRNMSEAGAVVNYGIALHCPLFIAELRFGDVLELTDYDRTYRARMAKKASFNYGTDIWIDELGN